MGDLKSIKFFDSNSIGNETYFGVNGEYTGNSLRYSTNVFSSSRFKLNAKPLFNTNEKSEISPQLRLTASSSDLNLGTLGKNSLSASLENRTTFKFDKNFKKQDIANSARVNFKARNGDLCSYTAIKFDCSQKKPDLKFAGVTMGLQKDFGKKLSAYIEGYLPKECFQGSLKNTSCAVGFNIKL